MEKSCSYRTTQVRRKKRKKFTRRKKYAWESREKDNSVIKSMPLNLMTNVPKLWGEKEIMQEISIPNKRNE